MDRDRTKFIQNDLKQNKTKNSQEQEKHCFLRLLNV